MKYCLTTTLLLFVVFVSACTDKVMPPELVAANTDEQRLELKKPDLESKPEPKPTSKFQSTANVSIFGFWSSIEGGPRASWEFNNKGQLRIGGGPWMRCELTGKDSMIISMGDSKGSKHYYTLNENKLAVYFDSERKNLISNFTRGK
ncbi:MAG: hypothetical protein ACI97A_003338 [Planctomycetota bacterium]|jgi:hypothetical protein